jgi:DNA-binding response OmpR family regulator
LLWARDGRDAELRRYEDQVLALLADHDGQVVQRAQVLGDDGPSEVQILRLGSEDALGAYMSDPRRTALAGQRDAAIERTDVLRIQLQ